MTDKTVETSRVRALAVFTYQMSAMIDVGIRLANIMITLSKDAPAPYDEFCRHVPARWEQDDRLPFSAIMEDRPELFPEFYIKTVKCGEYGGVLELSYGALAEIFETLLRLWTARGCPAAWIDLLLLPATSGKHQWAELDSTERKLVLYLFCKTLGAMLSSGVPIVTAGEIAAEFLPFKEREYFASGLMEALRPGGRLSLFLEEVGFAPPFLVRMVSIGEEAKEAGAGTLDAVLEKCALVYQRELEIGL